jgi:hypothetical protein
MIKAPVPTCEKELSPLILVAISLARTISPTPNEYGELVNVAIGTEHCVAETIVLSEPSQSTVSSVKVNPFDCRIRI